jgi:hypothetical protein
LIVKRKEGTKVLQSCLKARLDGFLRVLRSAHDASAETPLAGSSAGIERFIDRMLGSGYDGSLETPLTAGRGPRGQFVSLFLGQVMPPPYRFGTGVAIDLEGHTSGQLDIVVEYPFLPSFPLPDVPSRMYLAESVAAAIEVKFDASSEWEDVRKSAERLAPVRRDLRYWGIGGAGLGAGIPLIMVAFQGWKTPEELHAKLASIPLYGILTIEPAVFVRSVDEEAEPEFTEGAEALWSFVTCLHTMTRVLNTVSDVPLPDYSAVPGS